eukprot:4983000-Prymnesium_polylepis.2
MPTLFKGALAPPPPPPEISDTDTVASLLGRLLPSWGGAPAAHDAPSARDTTASRGAPAERAIFLPLGRNVTLPTGATLLGARAVSVAEAAALGAATGTDGEGTAWRGEWVRPVSGAAAAADGAVITGDQDEAEAAEEAAGAARGGGAVDVAEALDVAAWWGC